MIFPVFFLRIYFSLLPLDGLSVIIIWPLLPRYIIAPYIFLSLERMHRKNCSTSNIKKYVRSKF